MEDEGEGGRRPLAAAGLPPFLCCFPVLSATSRSAVSLALVGNRFRGRLLAIYRRRDQKARRGSRAEGKPLLNDARPELKTDARTHCDKAHLLDDAFLSSTGREGWGERED